MECLPVRPLIKYNPGDGAWIIAQKADQRKQFKAIICALKSNAKSKQKESKNNSYENKNLDNCNKFCIETILEHCRTVDPKKIAVLNISCKDFIPSNDEFYDFTSIYKIDASGNYLNLVHFISFNSLVELNLSSNNLKDINISAQDFEHLQILDLSFNNLSSEDILILGVIKNLKTLSLAGNNLRKLPPDIGEIFMDDDGNYYPRYSQLEELNLEYNHLNSDGVFSALGSLQKLAILKLAHNDLESIPLLKCMKRKIMSYKKLKFQNEYDIDEYEKEDVDFHNSFSENMNIGLRIPSTLLEVEDEVSARTNDEDENILNKDTRDTVINSNSTQIEDSIYTKTINESVKIDNLKEDIEVKTISNSDPLSIEKVDSIQTCEDITSKTDNEHSKENSLNDDETNKEHLNSKIIDIEKSGLIQLEDNDSIRNNIEDSSILNINEKNEEKPDFNSNIKETNCVKAKEEITIIKDNEILTEENQKTDNNEKENLEFNILNIENINSIQIDQVSSRNSMDDLSVLNDSNRDNLVATFNITESEETDSIVTGAKTEETELKIENENNAILECNSNNDETNNIEIHSTFDTEMNHNTSISYEIDSCLPNNMLNNNEETSENSMDNKVIPIIESNNNEKESNEPTEEILEKNDDIDLPKDDSNHQSNKFEGQMEININAEDNNAIRTYNIISNSPDKLNIDIDENNSNLDTDLLLDEMTDRTNISIIIDKQRSKISETDNDNQNENERISEINLGTNKNINEILLHDKTIQKGDNPIINHNIDNKNDNDNGRNEESIFQQQQNDESTQNQNQNENTALIQQDSKNFKEQENTMLPTVFPETKHEQKIYVLNSFNRYYNEIETEDSENPYYNTMVNTEDKNELIDESRNKENIISSLVIVNETLNSNTITDIIRHISTNSFGENMPKPFPALTYLDLSFNKIKQERAIIPIIAWLKLKNLIIHNNPLSICKVQNSSFIKSLLENTFKITVIWLPPCMEEKPRPLMKKSKLKPVDTIPSLPSQVSEKPKTDLPKLMPLPKIISDTKDLDFNTNVISLLDIDETMQKSNEENVLPVIEYSGKNKLFLLQALRYKLEHPITFFERKVDLFLKSNHLPKQKASNVNHLQKMKRADLISTTLQQQKMLNYETEISLDEILNEDYFKNDPAKLQESKIATRALNHMQKKYNQVRLEGLKKEW